MASTVGMMSAATVCIVLINPTSLLGQAFTAAEIQSALDTHNRARCEVSPPARSMPAVTWDIALAQVAQAWATRATQFAHNPNRDKQYARIGGKGPVGENLSLLSAALAGVPTVVGSWVGERRSYRYHRVAPTDTESNHYTQMVWAATRRIGCGKAPRTGNRVLYVCNYAPAGNVIGQFPYVAGRGANRACGGQ
jgi:hypothetical protein